MSTLPGHGDPGTIDIALNLASHIESVGRRVRTLRRAGKSADENHRVAKPEIVSAYPGWDHPDLIGWEINSSAAQPG